MSSHGHHHDRPEHGAHREPSLASAEASRAARRSLNRTALSATAHCLTGCAIGEVLGMVIGTATGLGTWTTVVLAVALAFVFGYGLTMLPLLRAGIDATHAVRLALASDTASIALMEVVDNVIMVAIPGAMHAGPTSVLFWGSLAVSLLIAGTAAFPLNRWLIRRGMGHALIHARHHHEPAGRERRAS